MECTTLYYHLYATISFKKNLPVIYIKKYGSPNVVARKLPSFLDSMNISQR